MPSPSREDRICAMLDSFAKTVCRNFVRNLRRDEPSRPSDDTHHHGRILLGKHMPNAGDGVSGRPIISKTHDTYDAKGNGVPPLPLSSRSVCTYAVFTQNMGLSLTLPVFYALMVEAARRDGFIPRPLEYYERVWDSMGPDHIKLLLAYLDGRAIAAAMPIHYARCTWYVYGASAYGRAFRNALSSSAMGDD